MTSSEFSVFSSQFCGAAVSASFVEHGTGASAVTLPSAGGTVMVDVVISTHVPVLGFSTRLAVSAPDAVAINTTGWSEQANVLYSFGQPGIVLPSAYNYNTLEWYAVGPSGYAVQTGWTLEQALASDVMGLGEPLTNLAGPVSVPFNEVFATAASLSGLTKSPPPHAPLTVATLTLHVAGQPGTYTLGAVEATYTNTQAENLEMEAGTPFTITVQSQ